MRMTFVDELTMLVSRSATARSGRPSSPSAAMSRLKCSMNQTTTTRPWIQLHSPVFKASKMLATEKSQKTST